MRYAASACWLAGTQSGARACACPARNCVPPQPWRLDTGVSLTRGGAAAARRWDGLLLATNRQTEMRRSSSHTGRLYLAMRTPLASSMAPRLPGGGSSLVAGKHVALLRIEDTLFDRGRHERSDLPGRAEWLWLSSKNCPVGKLPLAGGLTELLCSTAGQFSLVLQPGHKSFYFPQAQAPVLYTAYHLIKESKVTELVKVILPYHVQPW